MVDTEPGDRWSTLSVAQLLGELLSDQLRHAPLSIVGIDGRSRSGKTTLAERIAAEADNVAIVHTDDIAWHHSFFDWSDSLITNLLRPLRESGAPISFTPQAWIDRGRPGAIQIPSGTRLVIVEGVGAARLELCDWLDTSVWVDTAPNEALRRTYELNRDPPGFVEDWMRAEEAHLSRDQPWTRAAALVSGQHPIGETLHVRFNLHPHAAPSYHAHNRTFRVDGLLFDNDGVLVDSHDAAASAWNQWAATWAPHFEFHRDIQHGVRLHEVVAQLVPPSSAPQATQQLLDMEMRLTANVPPIPGARELTSECPPNKWAVVTSGVRSIALARLAAAGLPHPSWVISAEDTQHGKPAPDPYLAGAAALGLQPKRCAVFEDAVTGVHSARAAGIGYVIGVGEAVAWSPVDFTVRDLTGITFNGKYLTVPTEMIVTTR